MSDQISRFRLTSEELAMSKTPHQTPVSDVSGPTPSQARDSPPQRRHEGASQAASSGECDKLSELDEGVMRLVADEPFLDWARTTLHRHGEDEQRSLAIDAARLAVVDWPEAARFNDKVMTERLKECAMRVDAAWRFEEAFPDDWPRFFFAPLFIHVAEKRFMKRGVIRCGDITQDVRYIKAMSEVWLFINESRKGRKTRVLPPITEMIRRLRKYGSMHPDDVDIERKRGERGHLSLESWMDVEVDEVPLGYEGALTPEMLDWLEGGEAEMPTTPLADEEGCAAMGFFDFAAVLPLAIERLSPRQAEVLRSTVMETPSKRVASLLDVSESTVNNTRCQARAAVIFHCVEIMGREGFWNALPDHWKTLQVKEFIDRALSSKGSRGRRSRRRS